jgi:tungstate transport system substrate-binding protein
MQKIGCVITIFFIFSFLAFLGDISAQVKCTQVIGQGSQTVTLATGSPGELGLLQVLGEAFSKQSGVSLCWVKAGSGEAMRLLQKKDVEVIIAHDPPAEKKAVQDGWAAGRRLFGSNEFYLVGPASDPAGVSQASGVLTAFKAIAEKKALFVSRGDRSGTHQKEMEIWGKAGIRPEGSWYVETRDFMLASLKRADKDKGYFLTDSPTWISAKAQLPNLKLLFQGDPLLINPYHTLLRAETAQDPNSLGVRFVDFLLSDQGQQLLRDFGKDRFGQGLYLDARSTKLSAD